MIVVARLRHLVLDRVKQEELQHRSMVVPELLNALDQQVRAAFLSLNRIAALV
jgi:hypothetical protein